jgi:arylsulfatase
MAKPFKGSINLDIRDSTPDWEAFLTEKAPTGSPNVLVVLYDDTGQAAWSPYGGRIDMPTLDRLAENGLTYTQWHTTSVCSPTRSCFLTGRNHHQNGFGSISESAVGFPGYSGHTPPENATIATVLRDAGWSTFWIGKNHNVPVDVFDMASSATRSSPSPISPGTCGSARGQTTRPTTRRRSTSTSTRARSTTATRPTASGYSPA